MHTIPHSIFAPASNRPNPGRVLQEALRNEASRKQQRREWWSGAFANGAIFLAVVLGTIAVAIK